ncbi:MAG TPA: hypothetical protein ENJ35_08340 [Gammaproteobacteria bacterium]|nr:hypothetical protein [Gammaproteobacteria bacterium]
MKQTLLMEKYPVYSMVLSKEETTRQSVDEIIDYLKQHIEAHPVARYITTFDHYRHTRELAGGSIAEDILDAKDIVFCFGLAIPSAEVLAIRPRSIGVVERKEDFVISFLEAPMPMANSAMESWARGLME